ncbi:MAG: hypothetical protein E7619_07310 [Ruminococcaceae bacterium]|nr:hypothetical protein [Oscillospiraceae bacterium]
MLPTEFDEDSIVLSFGAISDVHVAVSPQVNKSKFTTALNTLLDFAKADDADGLDAVVIAGDMISNNSKGDKTANLEMTAFAKIVKDFANSSFGSNVLVAVGNHDTRSELSKLPSIRDTYLGEEYFAMDVENDLAKGYRHAVINDYHFIIAEPLTSPYGEFDEDVLDWIDKTLAEITAADPDRYVFFVTHPTVANTVYGSEDDFEPGHNRWRSTNLGAVLEKYPQVISFSGHTHSPIFDERCIMQTGFTAVNTGSTANTAFELDKYENMVENTLPVMDNADVSTGLMVQADANGNVKITRIMFSQNAEIKEAWYLEHPQTDGAHLETYTRDRREDENKAPALEGEITVKVESGKVKLSFPAGTDDDFVHHYTFTVKDASGKQVKEIFALTDFFCVTDASKMLKTFTYDIALGKGSYTVDIKAVDCWDAESGTISASFEVTEPMTEPVTEPVTDPTIEPDDSTDATLAVFDPSVIVEDITVITGDQKGVSLEGMKGISSLAAHANKSADKISVSVEEDDGEKLVRFTNEGEYTYSQLYINLADSVFTAGADYSFKLTFRLNNGYACTDSKGRAVIARLVDGKQRDFTVVSADELSSKDFSEWTTVEFGITAENAPTVLRIIIFANPGDHIDIKRLEIYGDVLSAEPITDPVVPDADAIKIACLGDSLTAGVGVPSEQRAALSYPGQLQALLGSKYNVLNCGRSGATVLTNFSKYFNGGTNAYHYGSVQKFKDAKDFAPDVAIIMLGTNDGPRYLDKAQGDPQKEAEYKAEFINELTGYGKAMETANPNVKVYLMLCPPYEKSADKNKNLVENIHPIIREVAENNGWTVIDAYSPISEANNNGAAIYSDGLHFVKEGYAIIAKTVAEALGLK